MLQWLRKERKLNMNKIVCPHCHNTFEIDNQDYASILNQVRDKEFEKQVKLNDERKEKEKQDALELLKIKMDNEKSITLKVKEDEINKLQATLKNQEQEREAKIAQIKLEEQTSALEEASKLKLKIAELEQEIKLQNIQKENALDKMTSQKDEEINSLKNTILLNQKEYSLKEATMKQSFDLIK